MSTRSIRAEKDFLRQRVTAFQVEIAALSKALADQKDAFSKRENEIYTSLFEVLDAFENLEKAYGDEERPLDKTSKKMLKSVQVIAGKIRRTLKDRGVRVISFPDGKARMDLCKVIETMRVPDEKNEHILCIEKNGYMDTERNLVLRKAEVKTVLND
jgi:molecular chaperone GrpE (heat shock protein)